MTILRPVLYGCCWKKPTPGFIDSLNVSGTFILAVGTGILKVAEGSNQNNTDIIPVDVMADYCIASSKYFANNKQTNIMNVSNGV